MSEFLLLIHFSGTVLPLRPSIQATNCFDHFSIYNTVEKHTSVCVHRHRHKYFYPICFHLFVKCPSHAPTLEFDFNALEIRFLSTYIKSKEQSHSIEIFEMETDVHTQSIWLWLNQKIFSCEWLVLFYSSHFVYFANDKSQSNEIHLKKKEKKQNLKSIWIQSELNQHNHSLTFSIFEQFSLASIIIVYFLL